jgi:hypothetical protein
MKTSEVECVGDAASGCGEDLMGGFVGREGRGIVEGGEGWRRLQIHQPKLGRFTENHRLSPLAPSNQQPSFKSTILTTILQPNLQIPPPAAYHSAITKTSLSDKSSTRLLQFTSLPFYDRLSDTNVNQAPLPSPRDFLTLSDHRRKTKQESLVADRDFDGDSFEFHTRVIIFRCLCSSDRLMLPTQSAFVISFPSAPF